MTLSKAAQQATSLSSSEEVPHRHGEDDGSPTADPLAVSLGSHHKRLVSEIPFQMDGTLVDHHDNDHPADHHAVRVTSKSRSTIASATTAAAVHSGARTLAAASTNAVADDETEKSTSFSDSESDSDSSSSEEEEEEADSHHRSRRFRPRHGGHCEDDASADDARSVLSGSSAWSAGSLTDAEKFWGVYTGLVCPGSPEPGRGNVALGSGSGGGGGLPGVMVGKDNGRTDNAHVASVMADSKEIGGYGFLSDIPDLGCPSSPGCPICPGSPGYTPEDVVSRSAIESRKPHDEATTAQNLTELTAEQLTLEILAQPQFWNVSNLAILSHLATPYQTEEAPEFEALEAVASVDELEDHVDNSGVDVIGLNVNEYSVDGGDNLDEAANESFHQSEPGIQAATESQVNGGRDESEGLDEREIRDNMQVERGATQNVHEQPQDEEQQQPSQPQHDHYQRTKPHSTRLSLSISSIEGPNPSLEIVPTQDVPSILPLWKENWQKERLEWERKLQLLEMARDKAREIANRSRESEKTERGIGTDKDQSGWKNGVDLIRSQTHLGAEALTYANVTMRRNRSDPITAQSGHGRTNHHHHGDRTSSNGSRKSRKYKYGMPPTIPSQFQKNPNPIVVKSSKKIGKKHARYALAAGMMLGIREGVGGAMGVEHELEIVRWKELERLEMEEKEKEKEKEENENENEDASGSLEQMTGVEGGCGADNNDSTSPPTRLSTVSTTSTHANSATSNSSRHSHEKHSSAFTTTLTRECERISKYKFPAHQFYLGSNNRAPLPHRYKFKVYAPLVFARIRALFGVEKQTFLHSICGKFNFYEFASNARSGQFFFYSHDGRYMIKTLTNTESKFLREILPYYYRHLTRNPHSFLTHFYGMYRVCMPDANNRRLHFIIMRSVFHTEKKIDRVWDLKGSKAGRKASKGDSVGKDLDILDEGKKLKFADPKARGAFLDQLTRDATFLARLGIMDYSLLLGLHVRGDDGGCATVCAEKGDIAESAYLSGSITSPSALTASKKDRPELMRSNTPFRRCVLRRAASDKATRNATTGDGFQELQELNQAMEKKNSSKIISIADDDIEEDVVCNTSLPQDRPLRSQDPSDHSPLLRRTPSRSKSNLTESIPPNPITPRKDMGIEGYGLKMADGSLAKREIYFCGIIDILQYYNARKIGETVMKKAAGNSGSDISCVDPESYGKRFVKFIANLVDE
mmetsp:Transcript_19412/g.40624  ORF Transcript_19412/g.40624 Transcript_19412/m.40624 type:complete len:1206 (+) Transcript_19412:181-3798(+)